MTNLGSEEFHKRETAQAEILAWARENRDFATEELYRQWKDGSDPEVRERCFGILRDLVGDEFLRDGEGYLGILMAEMPAMVPGDAEIRNVVGIAGVEADSPAAKAGLKVGDQIAGLKNGNWPAGPALKPFGKMIREMKPNSKVTLKILRDGNQPMDVEVTLGRRPARADIRFMGQSLEEDLAAAERAAKEAYFRRWLERRKSGN